MINTDNETVILHIPVQKQTIRLNGADREVFDLNQGFSYAEFADGEKHVVTNPLKMWVLDVTVNQGRTAGTGANFNLYFSFDPPGTPGNPGQDDALRSITDDIGPL